MNENENIPCDTCGKEMPMPLDAWLARLVKIHGTRCEGCTVKQELAGRHDEQTRIETERAHRWQNLCPVEFRLNTEGDGHTDIARMDGFSRDWKKVFRWKYGPKGLLT